MTAVSTFSSKIRSTLTKLSGIPNTKILVASVPDWYGLWNDFKNVPAATSVWASRGTCPTILGAGTSTADREAARQRITRYNTTLASVCDDFAACTYDGGALHALHFSASELAFDYFHFSVSGQARLASVLWEAGPFAVTRRLRRPTLRPETSRPIRTSRSTR